MYFSITENQDDEVIQKFLTTKGDKGKEPGKGVERVRVEICLVKLIISHSKNKGNSK